MSKKANNSLSECTAYLTKIALSLWLPHFRIKQLKIWFSGFCFIKFYRRFYGPFLRARWAVWWAHAVFAHTIHFCLCEMSVEKFTFFVFHRAFCCLPIFRVYWAANDWAANGSAYIPRHRRSSALQMRDFGCRQSVLVLITKDIQANLLTRKYNP